MGFKADTADLTKLAAAFKEAPKAVRKQYRRGLKDGGQLVADKAKQNIAPYSPPIAASIKVGSRGVTRVVITAGGGRPIATLLEGRRNASPKFRHPLFGDKKHWYDQSRHPYLWPAWEKTQKKVAKRMSDVIRTGLAEVDIEAKPEK